MKTQITTVHEDFKPPDDFHIQFTFGKLERGSTSTRLREEASFRLVSCKISIMYDGGKPLLGPDVLNRAHEPKSSWFEDEGASASDFFDSYINVVMTIH